METRIDGRLQTPGPTDLFNLLNEALALARVSGVRRLQASVVSMCAVALSDYLFAVTNDLVESPSKSNSCRYACALTNDCWTVLDHLDKLEADQNAVFEEYSVDLNPLRGKCGQHASRSLEVLAAQARSDLAPVLAKSFSRSHLQSTTDQEDVVAVVVATLDDYLEDFQATLEPPFLTRVAKMMVRDVVGAYLARLAVAHVNEGLALLTKREVDLIALDQDRLIKCLSSRFPRIEPRKLFGRELAALDDTIEFLRAPPALIPPAAVKAAQRDTRLRQHVAATAKMCVDLVCNADAATNAKTNDKFAKEIKSRVVMEIDDRAPAGASDGDAVALVELERDPYVVMWPGKTPGTATAAAIKKAKDALQQELEREHAQFERIAAPVVAAAHESKVARNKMMVERQKSQATWQPVQREVPPQPVVVAQPQPAAVAAVAQPQPQLMGGAAAVGAAAVAGGAAAAAAPAAAVPPKDDIEFEPHIVLQYRDPDSKKTTPSVCALKRMSEHSTDLAFVRYAPSEKPQVPAKAGTTVAFRAPVTEIVRVEYWSAEAGPGHFGPDGVPKPDQPSPDRAARRDVEFALLTRHGDKLHFTAQSPQDADKWVTALRKACVASYAKWGSTFKEGEEEYLAMSIKELRAAAKRKGVDLSGCVERQDMIKALVAGKTATALPKSQASASAVSYTHLTLPTIA